MTSGKLQSEPSVTTVLRAVRTTQRWSTGWKRWVAATLALPVLYAVLDFILGRFNGWSVKQWQFYGLSMFASGSLWVLFYSIIRRIRERRRSSAAVLAVIVSVVYGTNLTLVYGYLRTVGAMPNYYTFEYLFDAPLNSWFLLRDSFTWVHGILVALTCLGFFTVLYRPWRPARSTGVRLPFSRLLVLASLILYLILQAVLHNNIRFVDQCFSADMTTATSLLRNTTQRVRGTTLGRSGLLARMPMPLPELPMAGLNSRDGRPVNVLFVLTESLRADGLGMYGNPRPSSPFLDSMVATNPQRAVRFDRALSNTSTTLIAMPCLFTGLSPVQEAKLVHTMPVYWEYFKALGYETFFMTSQSHEWYNIKSFFQIRAIDETYNKEISGHEFANDLGVDDRYLVDHFLQWIDAHDTSRPFAGVVQVNATHYPYWTPDNERPFGTDSLRDKYDNAVRYMDIQISRMFKGLQAKGLLDHTLIVLTSDHGEAFWEHGIMGHRDGYYREFLHIPMLWFVPPGSVEGRDLPGPAERLKANASLNVSNADIIPTLLDFFGIWTSPTFASIRAELPGQSLLGSVDSTRPIIACNNNEISRYRTGLSLVMGDCHYILNLGAQGSQREELYWWSTDPAEHSNEIGNVDAGTQARIYQTFARYPLCRTIFGSCGITLPVADTSLRATSQ